MKVEREKKRVLCKQVPPASSITCGSSNPSALGCTFYELEDGEIGTIFTPQHMHEGHRGVMHGGMSAAVLDELMGRAILHTDFCRQLQCTPTYVTAEMTVEYKKPVFVGSKMYGYGKIDKVEGRRCYTSSVISDENDEIMAEAKGIYVRVDAPDDPKAGYTAANGSRTKLDNNDPVKL